MPDVSQFTRGTSELDVDRFNQWLRSQPWHQEYLRRIGQAGGAINLSERQQKELAQIAAQHGVQMPDDFSFDQAGNLNQNSRLGRNLALAGLIGGGALTGFGLAGLGPLSGLGGGGAAAGGAAGSATGGTGAASQLLGMQGLASGAGAHAASLGGALGSGLGGAAMGGAAGGALGNLPWGDILQAAAPLGVSLAGRAFGGGGEMPQVQGSAELNELLRLAMERMRAQQPLSEALNRQALAGLPSYAQGK